MNRVQEYRKRLEREKGKEEQLRKSIHNLQSSIKDLTRDLKRHEEAREIIKQVGLSTQQQLQYNISDITSLALEAVFQNPYELKAEFVERRNKTECDLVFVREDNRVDPLTASGGGAVDVAAFALRVASWSMENPKSRNVIILDEPMRFLSRDLQDRASLMLKEISEKLGLQFIIITHEPTLTENADRVFEVRNKKGKSIVTLIE